MMIANLHRILEVDSIILAAIVFTGCTYPSIVGIEPPQENPTSAPAAEYRSQSDGTSGIQAATASVEVGIKENPAPAVVIR